VWEITVVRLLCRRADPIIGTTCAKICQPQKVFRRDTLFTINQKMKKNRPQTQHLMVIGVAVVRAARKSQTITHKPDKHA
jgi:hypothetical protein